MYKCPFCGKEFIRLQDFNVHVLKCTKQYATAKKERKRKKKKFPFLEKVLAKNPDKESEEITDAGDDSGS